KRAGQRQTIAAAHDRGKDPANVRGLQLDRGAPTVRRTGVRHQADFRATMHPHPTVLGNAKTNSKKKPRTATDTLNRSQLASLATTCEGAKCEASASGSGDADRRGQVCSCFQACLLRAGRRSFARVQVTTVPLGLARLIKRSAPITAARFRMMRRPSPSLSSPWGMPMPSSRISRMTALFLAYRETSTFSALACFRALV